VQGASYNIAFTQGVHQEEWRNKKVQDVIAAHTVLPGGKRR
jgi:hypothetical protein